MMKQLILLAALFMMTAQTTFASTNPVMSDLNIEEMRGSINGVYETQGKGGYAHYYVNVLSRTKVVMVALNFDQTFACAFEGTIINNTTIEGDWLSLPFGKFEGDGTATMKIQNNGRSIAITDGDLPHATLKKIDPRRVTKWPAQSGGFFSGGSTNDITGTYQGDNGHRLFMRQKGDKIVFFSESFRTKANKNRPGMAAIFISDNVGSGEGFSGKWYTLPMGVSSDMNDEASFEIIGPKYFRFDGGYFPGVAYRSLK